MPTNNKDSQPSQAVSPLEESEQHLDNEPYDEFEDECPGCSGTGGFHENACCLGLEGDVTLL